ncbi:MAG: hypothetical protein ACFFBE_07585 [Promethearchaeota archaeon]
MDCYDEILNLYSEKRGINKYISYLIDLINKKSKNLTELQFRNCLILVLAIWNPKFIDLYGSEEKEAKYLRENEKGILKKILKSEFEDFDNHILISNKIN